jgi:hypothetical protein
MTTERATRRLAANAAARGAAPRIDDFNAAMSEAGRRRRRRGVQSAGVGAALVAVVSVIVGFGAVSGSANARDEVRFVDGTTSDDSSYDGMPQSAQLGAPAGVPDAAAAPGGARHRSRSSHSDSADGATTVGSTRGSSVAMTRTNSAGSISTCNADWCLEGGSTPAGKGAYTFSATLCLNTGVALRTLDFATAQEAEFEVLSAGRVIWRWSDRQVIKPTPHQLSALAAECFTWQTKWTQYDGNGDRVGKARLTLRARSTAGQVTSPTAATVTFMTSAV